MEILQVTEYDVLADRMPGRRYILEDYRRHIGNTRFAVLVDMYREAYNTLLMRGNDIECEKIVDRIVGVACHKDVAVTLNKGRFLIRKFGEGSWVCLDEDESKELARQALASPGTILEEFEDWTGEVVASTAFSAMNLAVETSSDDNFNNDKKRGRRRSLLRRSASESTMMDDKKKLQIRGLGLDNSEFIDDDLADFQAYPDSMLPRPLAPSVVHAHPPETGNVVKIFNWKGMDVVLSSSGRTLSTKENIIGNNRLNVMISLQKDTYQNASPEEKDAIADGLLKVIGTYWGGRILLDQGVAYAELSEQQATIAMKNLLDPGCTQPIMVSTGSSNGLQNPFLADAPPLPEFLREASIEILSSDTPSNPKVMQNQAIKSLQERKAKRIVAKNLGRILVNGDSDLSTGEY